MSYLVEIQKSSSGDEVFAKKDKSLDTEGNFDKLKTDIEKYVNEKFREQLNNKKKV